MFSIYIEYIHLHMEPCLDALCLIVHLFCLCLSTYFLLVLRNPSNLIFLAFFNSWKLLSDFLELLCGASIWWNWLKYECYVSPIWGGGVFIFMIMWGKMVILIFPKYWKKYWIAFPTVVEYFTEVECYRHCMVYMYISNIGKCTVPNFCIHLCCS